MKLKDLTASMYYSQQIRIFECSSADRLKKTLLMQCANHDLRSVIFKELAYREVIGFGIGTADNVIDINIEQEEA